MPHKLKKAQELPPRDYKKLYEDAQEEMWRSDDKLSKAVHYLEVLEGLPPQTLGWHGVEIIKDLLASLKKDDV